MKAKSAKLGDVGVYTYVRARGGAPSREEISGEWGRGRRVASWKKRNGCFCGKWGGVGEK